MEKAKTKKAVSTDGEGLVGDICCEREREREREKERERERDEKEVDGVEHAEGDEANELKCS